MSTHKRIDAICAVVLALTLVLTVLFMNGEALGVVAIASGDAESDMFTANDLNGDWDTSSATQITLSDQGSTVNGNGAYVYGGDVHIVYAGRYVLTGGLTNGSIIVDASKTDKIWLSLDGVSLHCDDNAAIRVEQADKVFLTLADGTTNTVSSGAEYSEGAVSSGVDGVIYSRDDLTINGSGALTVTAEYKHGIVCNDSLVIVGPSIDITAARNGIRVHDSASFADMDLTLNVGNKGITVKDDDVPTSYVYIESGTITIPSCTEGIEAVDITITGGTIYIMTDDDGINACGTGGGSVLRISGGDITIIGETSRDCDGLDSNGNIEISGGKVFISLNNSGSNSALDYGSENGGVCTISGGTVVAAGSSMMAEGPDSSSPQGFLMYSTNAQAGTVISLTDSTGEEILSAEIPCSFSSIVLSAPELSVGDVCTLTIGDVQEQVTIDNTSTSGFAMAGMFGGGMRGGRDFNGTMDGQEGAQGNPENGVGPAAVPDENGNDAPPEAREFPAGIEPSDGMRMPNGEGMPDGRNGMEDNEGQTMPSGDRFPGYADGMPGGVSTPESGDASAGTDTRNMLPSPDGLEAPNEKDAPDGGNWMGQRGGWADGETQLTPGRGQPQEGGGRFQQQDWEQMGSEGAAAVFNITSETVILLGVSVLALLIGLLVAIKVKH